MRVYEFKREKRVEEITELIKNIQQNGEAFNRKEIILVIMDRYNVSRRTANDYLNLSIYKNEHP